MVEEFATKAGMTAEELMGEIKQKSAKVTKEEKK